jgi:putative adhesin
VRGRILACTVAALAALAGWGRADEVAWQGRLAPGQTLEVKGVNGRIDATAAAEGEVRATKRSRRSDTASVELKVVQHAGGITVCAVYPTPEGSAPNECVPGHGGRMNTRDNDVEVDFTVAVPVGVRFVARTVNGSVGAASLTGDVDAHTVNGSVSVSTSGNVEAQTVNGAITASAGRADWSGAADFRTVNGSITVALPSDTSAEVEAHTVNGEIASDFPISVQRLSRHSLHGTIGAGGRQLRMQTVNGAVKLKKST